MPEKVNLGDWRERTPLIERAAETLTQPPDPDAVEARPPKAPHASKLPDASSVAPPAPPTQGAARVQRQSRFDAIDFDRLARLGFLTPNAARSRTKEEFRVIKRSVLQHAFQPGANRNLPGNLIMVSSARPGEGKTFTAVNLAISIALERDYTVLLIDADFARPRVLEALGLSAERGLVDVLEDPTIDLSEVLIRTNIDRLTVLPAGRSHNLSTELLASQRMKDMVADIARRYRDRIVIFDAPPILSTSEPGTLAMHVGQVVFVIEAGKTPKSAVQEALDVINTGARIGVVLNRCDTRFGQVQFGSYYER